MKKKIFLSISITAIIMSLFAYALSTIIIYNNYSVSLRKDIMSVAERFSEEYNENPEFLNNTNIYSDMRITLMSQTGEVIYDSFTNEESLSNHGNRPEFKTALKTGTGESSRISETLNKSTYNYAILQDDGSVLRTSKTMKTAISFLLSSIYPILSILIIVVLCSLFIAIILTKKIVNPINHIDLENPLKHPTYPELKPLLENMHMHNKIRKEFTANVSHELKTPLTSISGYAEIMENNLQGNNTTEFSKRIVNESKHLLRLIDDIIKLSKLDEGNVELDFEIINYQSLLTKIVDNLQTFVKDKKVSIIQNTEIVHGEAVPMIIYESLYNIIQNAIKYNKENGHVWIDCREIDNIIEIKIKDDGIGILEKDQTRVFERFYRADKSHSNKIEGTGLGLAIAKHGIEFHHGSIDLESSIDKGTTFIIG